MIESGLLMKAAMCVCHHCFTAVRHCALCLFISPCCLGKQPPYSGLAIHTIVRIANTSATHLAVIKIYAILAFTPNNVSAFL